MHQIATPAIYSHTPAPTLAVLRAPSMPRILVKCAPLLHGSSGNFSLTMEVHHAQAKAAFLLKTCTALRRKRNLHESATPAIYSHTPTPTLAVLRAPSMPRILVECAPLLHGKLRELSANYRCAPRPSESSLFVENVHGAEAETQFARKCHPCHLFTHANPDTCRP